MLAAGAAVAALAGFGSEARRGPEPFQDPARTTAPWGYDPPGDPWGGIGPLRGPGEPFGSLGRRLVWTWLFLGGPWAVLGAPWRYLGGFGGTLGGSGAIYG